jgi:hypothetical protein
MMAPPSPSLLPSIALSLTSVNELRALADRNPRLRSVILAVKRVQCRRFQHTYADVLAHKDWQNAANFFLKELYSDQDFTQRDQEFARIATTLQRVFPPSVLQVATVLLHLHALSEQLDHALATSFLSQSLAVQDDAAVRRGYVQAWRDTGQAAARAAQIALVVQLGQDLSRLVRITGLRTMLRLMRGPAAAAGLAHLQTFLELGFDTFSSMQRSKAGSAEFLKLVELRETSWVARLFDTSVTSTTGTGAWPELE